MSVDKPSHAFSVGGLWELTNFSRVVTFVGAGGKTTCLKTLTSELSLAGKKVVATTSTHVFPVDFASSWLSTREPPDSDCPSFWYTGVDVIHGKWRGPATAAIDTAIALEKDGYSSRAERYWVIEGDGAKGRKLKCWASHEPQIPLATECAVLLVHGGLTDKVLHPEDIHRAELCPELIGRVWNARTAWDYFLKSPLFYSIYQHMFWVILFNEFGGQGEKQISLAELAAEYGLPDTLNKRQGPAHLRIAAGNVKEMRIAWCDLW